VLPGCALFPHITHEPTLHNPFPQITKVAVAPFFNQSLEPTLHGERIAAAYFNELQLVPGFEVVPVGVVAQAINMHKIDLRSGGDARRLAQILGVDAVVIGTVTDYSPYYPPRLALQVDWYAANPGFHPIPPGYGLPWGTPEEEDIPAPLVFEAEFALAKAQLATQTPPYEKMPVEVPIQGRAENSPQSADSQQTANGVRHLQHQAPVGIAVAGGPQTPTRPEMPRDWPDPRGFVSPPPGCRPRVGRYSDAPVLTHTRNYNGNDSDFTQALSSYYYFRDDARLGGWQAYLMRSDDFLRFCCHKHIAEMLTARGGAGETRVVWRWPCIR
jgi:hypothetical protein